MRKQNTALADQLNQTKLLDLRYNPHLRGIRIQRTDAILYVDRGMQNIEPAVVIRASRWAPDLHINSGHHLVVQPEDVSWLSPVKPAVGWLVIPFSREHYRPSESVATQEFIAMHPETVVLQANPLDDCDYVCASCKHALACNTGLTTFAVGVYARITDVRARNKGINVHRTVVEIKKDNWSNHRILFDRRLMLDSPVLSLKPGEALTFRKDPGNAQSSKA